MDFKPQTKPTEEALAFYKRIGEALLALKESVAYKLLDQAELDNLEDIKTKSSMIPINDPNYERRMTYMAGMVEGLRRWRETKIRYLEKYREHFNKTVKQ